MKLKGCFLTLLLSSSYLIAGGNNSIGTPGSIIERLKLEGSRYSKSFSLKALDDESIDLAIEDYHFEDGYLAIHGNATSDFNSSFMLKGTEEGISGYIAFHDTKEAYRYKTDTNGKVQVEKVDIDLVHPTCELHPPEDLADFYIEQPNWGNGASEPHIGKYPGTNVNKLQSLPGAKKVFYLDITRIMNGNTPKHFSKAEMWYTWQSVASSLSMYKVNVTTDPAVYKKAGVKNSGIARFLDQDGRSNAPLNSFGTTQYSKNYKNVQKGYGLGRTAAHEIGHQLGLHHDGGQPGGEYFEGLPEFKWVPIMGNYWFGTRWKDDALYQWSKGEYSGASSKQDDLKLMERYLPYRDDDISDSKELTIEDNKVSADKNRGQIERTTDSDSFTFEVEENGHAKLKINRIEYIGGAMLDIAASLKDSSGKVIAKDNPKAQRFAQIDVDLKPGEYTLEIKGGGEGTPRKGFSNYSSLGFYGIEGTITGSE